MSDDPDPFAGLTLEALSTQQRADYAEQLLKNPLLWMLLAQMDTECGRVWRASTSREQQYEQHSLVVAIAILRGRIKAQLSGRRLESARAQRQAREPTY